jgi:hypothetical protein
MRDGGELRALAIRRYTGNWANDSRGILPDEMDEFETAWKGEAGRRYDLLERNRKAGLRVN